MTAGEKIKFYRTQKGLSQKELGKLLGVSQQMIGQYENKSETLKPSTLRKIAVALGCKISDLDDSANDYENTLYMILSCEKKIEEISALLDSGSLDETTSYCLHDDLRIYKNILADYQKKIEHLPESIDDLYIDLRSELLELFDDLNYQGQEKALEQVKLLARIPEYKKDSNP